MNKKLLVEGIIKKSAKKALKESDSVIKRFIGETYVLVESHPELAGVILKALNENELLDKILGGVKGAGSAISDRMNDPDHPYVVAFPGGGAPYVPQSHKEEDTLSLVKNAIGDHPYATGGAALGGTAGLAALIAYLKSKKKKKENNE